MYEHKKFHVDIERTIPTLGLRWPEKGEAVDDSGLGGNREYADMRRQSWSEANRVFQLESELIARVMASSDPEAECDAIDDELYEDDPFAGLFGLDLGVASTVIALSAARCIPFASCNGGAFGGHHHELYPLVTFFARIEAAPLLVECAAAAGIGIEREESGALVAFADNIPSLMNFAAELINRRKDFRALRFRRSRESDDGEDAEEDGQLGLF